MTRLTETQRMTLMKQMINYLNRAEKILKECEKRHEIKLKELNHDSKK